MIPAIRERLANRCRDGLVMEEFGVGYGVADVIVARPSPRVIARRHRLGQTAAVPSRAGIRVLRALQRHALALPELERATGLPSGRLRETLRFLIANNFVDRDAAGAFSTRGAYRPVAREIWAVEAKMKNWFEGVCQARRYQHFAHRAYLAILDRNLALVKSEILRSLNVGLIAVSGSGARIVFHPRRTKPRSEDLFLLSNERIWGATWSASTRQPSWPPPEIPPAMS